VSQAAGILIEQLTPFQDYVKISQMKAEERLIRLSIPDEKYNMPVEQLDLSVRTMNCLRRSNISTVGELIGKGPKELLKLRNFGQKSYQEIEDRLSSIGLSLNPKPEEGEEEEEAGEVPEGEAEEETPAGPVAAEEDVAEPAGEELPEEELPEEELPEEELPEEEKPEDGEPQS
jgi:DNA-directed RNA polymerase subunit alpha